MRSASQFCAQSAGSKFRVQSSTFRKIAKRSQPQFTLTFDGRVDRAWNAMENYQTNPMPWRRQFEVSEIAKRTQCGNPRAEGLEIRRAPETPQSWRFTTYYQTNPPMDTEMRSDGLRR